MTEKERMEQGIIYNPNVSELTDEQSVYMEKLWEFNQLRPSEQDQKCHKNAQTTGTFHER